ncbi:MAG: L,D-transpeptidase family protein [Candidatus Binataceae bacterium]
MRRTIVPIAAFAAMLALVSASPASAGGSAQSASQSQIISPWPKTASPGVPITGGDAERAGMLPPAPPYDPDAIRVREVPSNDTSEAAAVVANSATVPAKRRSAVPLLTPGEIAYRATGRAAHADPMNWSLMVFKGRHEVDAYYENRLFKRYHAVFGRSFQPGAKSWDGDRRTPEGLYLIVGEHRSRRWRWFLELDYPNKFDRDRYQRLRGEHLVPIVDGHPAGLGGRIGIHGTDEPILNVGNVNWTTGCISVDNSAIDQLHRLLPIGTLVVIKP